jgi:hydrogenase maturation protein HypF
MKAKRLGLPFKMRRAVLALGSQVKNTICFASLRGAVITQVHDNLTSPGDLSSFERDATILLKKKPAVIAYDLHPDYLSTHFAFSKINKYKLMPVQHHHAHIAACMADNALANSAVIGVAFDGTGLGSDNKIWGGEFLVCDYRTFKRKAHLKEVPLVGGEQAIKEPWRLLAAWFDFPKSLDSSGALKKICSSGINSPLASSMGRLFDAAASIVLNKKKAAFEAELAIQLEKIALNNKYRDKGYQFKINKLGGIYIIDPVPVLKRLFNDSKNSLSKERMAWRFHLSVAEMVLKTCVLIRKDVKLNKVALSGGVFQNKVLLSMILELLPKNGFKVYTHKNLSCNDSCLSLGQAAVANYRS